MHTYVSLDAWAFHPQLGDVVDLATHDGKFIARGLWNPASRLRVRLYAFDAHVALDASFWTSRIEAACALRRTLGLDDRAGAARLVNSEGDDLSGLIVDRYGEWLAVQVTALAMASRLDVLCDALETAVAPKGILLRGAAQGVAALRFFLDAGPDPGDAVRARNAAVVLRAMDATADLDFGRILDRRGMLYSTLAMLAASSSGKRPKGADELGHPQE